MDNIEIKWSDDGNGRKYITSEGINTRIEIDEENKEIKNAKSFFREIIYQSFLNDWKKQISFVDDQDLEIDEVKKIINELVQLCNNELDGKQNN